MLSDVYKAIETGMLDNIQLCHVVVHIHVIFTMYIQARRGKFNCRRTEKAKGNSNNQSHRIHCLSNSLLSMEEILCQPAVLDLRDVNIATGDDNANSAVCRGCTQLSSSSKWPHCAQQCKQCNIMLQALPNNFWWVELPHFGSQVCHNPRSRSDSSWSV